jgi:6-phosphogluconolactonase
MSDAASPRSVRVLPTPEALAEEGARLVRELAQAAVRERGRFMAALAGGLTPRGLYAALAGSGSAGGPPVDWRATHVFFGDERHVPPEHPDSNYRMVHETLLSHVPVQPANVHRMPTELDDASMVASQYEATVREVFGLEAGDWPQFDVALLGMGRDGHTASIFPRSPVVDEREHLATAVWVISLQSSRVTLTLPVFNHARDVLVLVSGVEKAETLRAALEGPFDPETYPVQGLRPVPPGRVSWLVDAPAASRLSAATLETREGPGRA